MCLAGMQPLRQEIKKFIRRLKPQLRRSGAMPGTHQDTQPKPVHGFERVFVRTVVAKESGRSTSRHFAQDGSDCVSLVGIPRANLYASVKLHEVQVGTLRNRLPAQ